MSTTLKRNKRTKYANKNNLKSDKFTPFGSIFYMMKKFSRLEMSTPIDKSLELCSYPDHFSSPPTVCLTGRAQKMNDQRIKYLKIPPPKNDTYTSERRNRLKLNFEAVSLHKSADQILYFLINVLLIIPFSFTTLMA